MTKLNWSGAGVLGLAALLAGACASQKAKNQPPQRAQLAQAVSTPKAEPAERLSPLAMATLKSRMASHARDMDKLVSAIMVLDYPNIAQRANDIAADVNLSRPLTKDASELNSSLPERFFVHQDDLKMSARELSAAASALNPYQVADAYGKVSAACVRCHADYRPRTGG